MGTGLIVSVFIVPIFGGAIAKNFPEYALLQYPISIGLYLAALFYFFALLQFWLMVNEIDRDGKLLATRLRAIQLSAIAFSVLYVIFAMPVIFLAADAEDAPGLILFGMYLTLFPIGTAAFAAILVRVISE